MLLQRTHTARAKTQPHHHIIDLIADVNAVVNGLSLFPQLYHAWTASDLSAISLPTFLITGCAQIIWQLYGWHRRSYPIIISSALLGICSFAIVLLVVQSR